MNKLKTNKLKTKKSLVKKVKITGTGKLMRSHQLRSGHLKTHKSKQAKRRHQTPMRVSSAEIKTFKKMLG